MVIFCVLSTGLGVQEYRGDKQVGGGLSCCACCYESYRYQRKAEYRRGEVGSRRRRRDGRGRDRKERRKGPGDRGMKRATQRPRLVTSPAEQRRRAGRGRGWADRPEGPRAGSVRGPWRKRARRRALQPSWAQVSGSEGPFAGRTDAHREDRPPHTHTLAPSTPAMLRRKKARAEEAGDAGRQTRSRQAGQAGRPLLPSLDRTAGAVGRGQACGPLGRLAPQRR